MMRRMMSRKGFTLMELLAVIVILSIVLTLAISGVGQYIGRGKKSYYQGLESTILAAGRDYFLDYRSLLPREIGNTSVVTSNELILNKYLNKIVDEDKKECNAEIIAEKIGKQEYHYHVCLQCNERYVSAEESCNLVGNNNQAKSFDLTLNVDFGGKFKQCDPIEIPTATLTKTEGDESTETTVSANPDTIDSKILGETSVVWSYRYKSITKKVSVVDEVKPTKPKVTLKNLDGSRYQPKKADGSPNIVKTVEMTVESDDWACGDGDDRCLAVCRDTYGSGVRHISYRNKDSSNWTTISMDKTTKISGRFFGNIEVKTVDGSNNESDPTDIEAYVDNSAPSKTIVTYLSGRDEHMWQNNIQIKLEAIDDVQIAYFEYDYNYDGVVDGTTSEIFDPPHLFSFCKVRFRAVDLAGNRGAWSDTHHIHMDTKAPSDVSIHLENYTSNQWTTKDVTVKYTATDGKNESGVSHFEVSYNGSEQVGNGIAATNGKASVTYRNTMNQTIYVRAVDKAGNKGQWTEKSTYVIKIDKVLPQCSLAIVNQASSISYQNATWYTSDVQVGIQNASDNDSGVHTVYIKNGSNPFHINTTTKGTIVTGEVWDKAGNRNTCKLTIKADLTKPTITVKEAKIQGNTSYMSNFTNNINYSFGPTGGSLSCNPATPNTASVGTYNVTCTAIGNNSKKAATSFTVTHSYYASCTTTSVQVEETLTYTNPRECSFPTEESWRDGEVCIYDISSNIRGNLDPAKNVKSYQCNDGDTNCPNGRTGCGDTCTVDQKTTVPQTTCSCSAGGTLNGNICYY
ncbi:MAG: type II secretion system protein [bacterium]|nr:type II secretion system protein [bacterium]